MPFKLLVVKAAHFSQLFHSFHIHALPMHGMLWNMVYILGQESLLSALLNWFKLVYAPLG